MNLLYKRILTDFMFLLPATVAIARHNRFSSTVKQLQILFICSLFVGVVLALKVPQLAVRKQNLSSAIQSLTTIASLHQTQPTIQVVSFTPFRTIYISFGE